MSSEYKKLQQNKIKKKKKISPAEVALFFHNMILFYYYFFLGNLKISVFNSEISLSEIVEGTIEQFWVSAKFNIRSQ